MKEAKGTPQLTTRSVFRIAREENEKPGNNLDGALRSFSIIRKRQTKNIEPWNRLICSCYTYPFSIVKARWTNF